MPDRSSAAVRPRRVLVVEDDDDQADVLVELLSTTGYDVERACDGSEALGRLERDPLPNLILLDLRMPGMDGWEFRSQQRASLRLSDIPVIVASGDAPDPGTMEVDYFLRKPFTAESLQYTVRNAFSALDREYTRAERLTHLQRLASLGILVDSIGHQINNALTYVFGGAEFAQRELTLLAGELPDGRLTEVLSNLQDLRTGIELIANVVKSLRIVGRKHGPASVVELPPLLAAAVTIVRGEILPRARLHEDYGTTPPVLADEAALTHVFVNLLLNAVQAIDAPHRNEIRIRTSTDSEGLALVEVQDTGAGIPEALCARVFEPFFSTKPVGVGTGLGLSVCRTIVEAHGGTITFASEVGLGTTFRVSLPAAKT